GVLVEHPAEGFLVGMYLFLLGRTGSPYAEATINRALPTLHLREQFGADGEQIAARKAEYLVHFSEARAHDLGPVAELFEIIVNASYGRYARVLAGRDIRSVALFAVPVVD